jgi:Ca2+-binding RTX toxin-like protein
MTARSISKTAACVTLVAAAVWAPQASATSIELLGPSPRFGSPGAIYVSGYRSEKSHVLNIAYKARGDSYVVTDSRPFGSIDAQCRQLAKRKVRCADPAPTGDADVSMSGGEADDRLRVDDSVRGSLDLSGDEGRDLLRVASGAHGFNSIFGGPGRDRILGGPRGGTLWGGTGRDEIHGGRGDDAVYDGGGKDLARTGKGADIAYVEVDYSPRNRPFSTENRIYLGPGIDEISARNGHRDGLLSCGRGGDDEAILDANDPKPRSCEILQRGREAP